MKKFINELENIEAEMVRGLVSSKAHMLRRLPDSNVVVRTQKKRERVAVLFGCGSGHEPAPCGYVGYGMLDAAVPGSIFSSPTPDQILKGIREISSESGVLCILNNYTGDVMNFRMAIQMAQAEGIAVDSVVVADDVASDISKATGRRGLAGAILINKIAGAEAEMVIEAMEDRHIVLLDGPLAEGAVVAAVEAKLGSSLEVIARRVEEARSIRKLKN